MLFATAEIAAEDRVRGIATSGWRGRSFSLGIADAVTVLADRASLADAAATLIANAVDLPGSLARSRALPRAISQPDSDLGERLVTVGVGPLGPSEIEKALEAGAVQARAFLGSGTHRRLRLASCRRDPHGRRRIAIKAGASCPCLKSKSANS